MSKGCLYLLVVSAATATIYSNLMEHRSPRFSASRCHPHQKLAVTQANFDALPRPIGRFPLRRRFIQVPPGCRTQLQSPRR
ncbi:hypothetical protein B0H11DRAFT_641656 [Mycena galericulata]|nr:hypothetical protein B0H11DRAFT_641656 [Mycena galericulata]